MDELPQLPIPAGHVWQPGHELGRGGGGSARLWKQIDENGGIIRRIVMKSIESDPLQIVIQKDPGKGELREAWMMEQLNAIAPVAKVHSVPVLKKPTGHQWRTLWTIYMPYYPYGSLADLIEPNFMVHRWIWPLPEPFIWWVFHRLSTVAVAMDTQLRTPDRQDVLVHLDIKPENIFMGTPGSEGDDADFPMYPSGVLGDFGSAKVTYEGDPEVGQLTNHGTVMWIPPEIDAWRPGHVHKSANRRPAHSYTNVWQIGLVILGMMEGQGYAGPKPIWFIDRPENPATTNPKYKGARWRKMVEDDKFHGWSDDLLSLVYQCTEFLPEDRPSPEQLIKRVEELLPAHEDSMKRWGTSDWFQQQEKEAARDAEVEEATGGDPEPDSSGGKKRKRERSIDEGTEARKQRKIREDVTQRRKKLVGVQMAEGRRKHEGPPDHVSPDDDRFVLREELKMFYPNLDPLFDVEGYFVEPHPKAEEPVEVADVAEGSGFDESPDELAQDPPPLDHHHVENPRPPEGYATEDREGRASSWFRSCCGQIFRFVGIGRR